MFKINGFYITKSLVFVVIAYKWISENHEDVKLFGLNHNLITLDKLQNSLYCLTRQ